MKFLIPAISSILIPCAMSAATYHHEFGTIAEDGGVVSHTFTLSSGDKPISVVNAFPGCPCVTVDYPRRLVKGGEPLKILLKYDPERQKGHFTKSVYLRLSGGRRDTLVVTGTVKRLRPRVDPSRYPNEFGLGLCLDREFIDFGTMRRGTAKTLTIPMANSYQIGMALDLRPQGRDSSMLSIPFGLKIGPESLSQFKVSLSIPGDAPEGTPRCHIRPVIHGVEVDSIPVRVRIIR
ncbi:DUF1573 domain-containing protein [uncultured Muribaculum sp.]|uniref:DUF1573 domain-containing protein n=1 Tax=uncultured Muribaculum sp. TaxID=1918613 RepID=UPI0025DDE05C|nr:DUF1573 domain-containing protein [uncultured Muribaculum sp.]